MTAREERELEAQADAYQAQADTDRAAAPQREIERLKAIIANQLATLTIIRDWYAGGGKSLSASAMIGPEDMTVVAMIDATIAKATGVKA